MKHNWRFHKKRVKLSHKKTIPKKIPLRMLLFYHPIDFKHVGFTFYAPLICGLLLWHCRYVSIFQARSICKIKDFSAGRKERSRFFENISKWDEYIKNYS